MNSVGIVVADAPLVTVVMPAYNAAATLSAAMRSVLDQTYGTVELIVVDDHSTDASWAGIEAMASQDDRVVPLRMPRNGGVATARNVGLDAARGRYIAFLDSDDQWHRDKLRIQMESVAATGARASYAAYRRVDASGRELSVVRPPASVDYAAMLASNRIGQLTGLYDRELGELRFRRIGHEDYVFWLEIVRRAGTARRAGEGAPLADYLVRDGSLSSDKWKAARWQWRIYRDVERLGIAKSAWYFTRYVGNAVAKRR